MIDRRFFLRLTGMVATVSALAALRLPVFSVDSALEEASAGTRAPNVLAPGSYQISGRVRLQEPVVVISGITNTQRISWTPGSLSTPAASFTSFERFDQPSQVPDVRVSGGQLELLRVLPLDVD